MCPMWATIVKPDGPPLDFDWAELKSNVRVPRRGLSSSPVVNATSSISTDSETCGDKLAVLEPKCAGKPAVEESALDCEFNTQEDVVDFDSDEFFDAESTLFFDAEATL
ncbi:hypothetical protein N7470_002875 [Penicillium chermesinum]|nr:hypothetical protein N7470_002875 [Penicillium chermesinum]